MTSILRRAPLLVVPLVGLSILNCREQDPTAPDLQPVTTTVQIAEAANSETPTVTAAELLQDPALDVFLGALSIPHDAERIRRAMDAVVTDLGDGDAARAQKHFADARKAVADYGKSGDLDPDDDLHLDVIDIFLDGVEEVLPEADEGPAVDKNK